MRTDWHIKQLANLDIEWKRGAGLRKIDLNDVDGVPCIHYGELYTKHHDKLIDNSKTSKTKAKYNTLSRKGDVLVPGTSTAEKSKMLVAREVDTDGIVIGSDINVIRPKKGLFAPKYLPYFFETTDAFMQMEHYITGTAE